jgi:hypothetical protein
MYIEITSQEAEQLYKQNLNFIIEWFNGDIYRIDHIDPRESDNFMHAHEEEDETEKVNSYKVKKSLYYKIYGYILQDHEATLKNAQNHAKGIDWSSIEYHFSYTHPLSARYEDTENGIDLYYNNSLDCYYFVEEKN